ncbi:hypothetical protein [Rhodococcus erythropolis]
MMSTRPGAGKEIPRNTQIRGLMMIEMRPTRPVEATHITKRGHRGPRLVCELYPGYFVADGGGVIPAHMQSRLLSPLPASAGRSFPIPESAAARAAEWYDERRDWLDHLHESAHLRPPGAPTPTK